MELSGQSELKIKKKICFRKFYSVSLIATTELQALDLGHSHKEQ